MSVPVTATSSTPHDQQQRGRPFPDSRSPIMHVAILNASPVDLPVLRQLFDDADWCTCERVEIPDTNRESFFSRFDVALLVDRGTNGPDKHGPDYEKQEHQLEMLRRNRVGVLILTSRPWRFAGYGFGTVCLLPDSSIDKTYGVLLALSRSRPVMRLIDKQVDNIRQMSETLSHQHEETQNEMLLAARLQAEFLPHDVPHSGPIRFETIFRPCSWVSGDIYDIFRLDEHHWGFYLADAVGHGVAAGLLTMYFKHAIRTKRIDGHRYELIPPSEVMAQLNDQFASQELPDSQFITGWYGVINTTTLELRFAVAGHPPALLVKADGSLRELQHQHGCILGLAAGQAYSQESAQLESGDRIVLYSDGLEPILIAHRKPMPQMPEFAPGMREALRWPPEDLTHHLRSNIDSAPGSLSQADDVSVVVMDVGPPEAPLAE